MQIRAGYLPKRLVEYQLKSLFDRTWLAAMFVSHSKGNIFTSTANLS